MRQFGEVTALAENRVARMEPEDRYHPFQNFEYKPRSNGNLSMLKAFDNLKEVPSYELSDHAFRQMAERLRFPGPYVRTLPPGISHPLVNWHIHQEDASYTKALMFRSIKGETVDRRARAIMSDQYQPFDDRELFQAVETSFGKMGILPQVEIQMSDFQDSVTHVRMVWGQEEILDPKRGEVVRRGIHISNSEVGLRSVVIRAIVWVLSCSNGMVSQKDMGGIRHVGQTDRLRTKVQDAIGMAVNDGERLSAQFRDSLNISFENPVNVLEGISSDYGLSQEQFKRTLGHFTEGDGRTKFDVVQAITRSAQDEDNTEDRYQMELAGAKALDANLEKFDKVA